MIFSIFDFPEVDHWFCLKGDELDPPLNANKNFVSGWCLEGINWDIEQYTLYRKVLTSRAHH